MLLLLAVLLAGPDEIEIRRGFEPATPAISTTEPMYVRFTAGGAVTSTGDTPTQIMPAAQFYADGPVIIGKRAPLRLYAQLGMSAQPGDTEAGGTATFRSLEFAAGTSVRLGNLRFIVMQQDISTNVFAEVGFDTRLPQRAHPVLKYPRHYLIGIRFQEHIVGGYFQVGYGRHEAVGDTYGGEVVVAGSVPVSAANNVIVIGGEAMLTIGRAYLGRQRDIVRVGVGVDVVRALDLLSK